MSKTISNQIVYSSSDVSLDMSLLTPEVVDKMLEAHRLEYLGAFSAFKELDKRILARIAEWNEFDDEVKETVLKVANGGDRKDIDTDDSKIKEALSLYSVIESLQRDTDNKLEAVGYHEEKIVQLRITNSTLQTSRDRSHSSLSEEAHASEPMAGSSANDELRMDGKVNI